MRTATAYRCAIVGYNDIEVLISHENPMIVTLQLVSTDETVELEMDLNLAELTDLIKTLNASKRTLKEHMEDE